MRHERFDLGSRATSGVSRAELLGAFSYALDLTEGQPAGHCLRACWIGSHVGRALGLDRAALRDLYYAILLKDLGCSSNAARICELYQADDLAFKQGFKTVGTSLAATLHFVFSRTARLSTFGARASAVGNILKNGDAIAQELIVTRCTRGADIARSLRFSDAVCDAIYRLDEHWDGSGRPGRLRGEAIPLYARTRSWLRSSTCSLATPVRRRRLTRSSGDRAAGSIRRWSRRSWELLATSGFGRDWSRRSSRPGSPQSLRPRN